MNILIIYISNVHNNKNIIQTIKYDKLYLKKFDLLELYFKIKKYDYLVYLNDDTNYDFENLNVDIEKCIKIINDNNKIDQILFYNYEYVNINEKILQIDKEYIESQADILITYKKDSIKNINYVNYVNYINKNFDKFFMPSIINIKSLLNYKEKLIDDEHYELNFLNKIKINKIHLNPNTYYTINKINYINNNINDNLTIVTGYIELYNKKINKYETQKYDYLNASESTLKININMIIYISTEKLYSYVYEQRKKYNLLNKTKIILIKEEEYMYFYDDLNKVYENVKKNHINYSDAKKMLSVVSRYNFLKDTIYNNYFETEYFAWCDFGLSHVVKIPNNLNFTDDFNNKIKIAWIARFNNNTFEYNNKCLSGGFFIGKKNMIIELINIHYIYYKKLLDYGFTINDDKLLFLIFESNPHLFKTYFSVYADILNKI